MEPRIYWDWNATTPPHPDVVAHQDVSPRLVVTSPAANQYTVTVTSNRDANAATFTLVRAANGTTTRGCGTGSADKGGCSAQSGGSW